VFASTLILFALPQWLLLRLPAAAAAAAPAHRCWCGCLLLQADFVSRSMWDGRVTKGMTRQELAVLKAPLVYAEIMSFIKVRTGSLWV
jgi:hypothetical protein